MSSPGDLTSGEVDNVSRLEYNNLFAASTHRSGNDSLPVTMRNEEDRRRFQSYLRKFGADVGEARASESGDLNSLFMSYSSRNKKAGELQAA